MHWPSESPHPTEVLSRLQWAWHSPSLIRPEYSLEPKLQEMLGAFTPGEAACHRFLHLHSTRRTNRLGVTFERLVQASFETHPAVHTVIANLLIPSGEIDLLFSVHDEPDVFHAVELAVKFYVFDGSLDEPDHRWIGPGRRDTLFKKTRRIFELQAPRALLEPAQLALQAKIPGARIATSSTWVRGELFARAEEEALACETLLRLPQLNPEIIFRPCLTHSEFDALTLAERARPLTDRWKWICEASELTGSAPQSGDPIDRFIEAPDRAQMALTDLGPEQRRAFVTPPGWRDGQLGKSL